MYLIEFNLTPQQADELPAEVDAWLMATLMAKRRIEGEGSS